MEVIGEESQKAPGQAQGDENDPGVAVDIGDQPDGQADDERCAGRKAVQTIDEVESIGNPDKPKDGKRCGKNTQPDDIARERIGDGPDAKPKKDHEHGHDDLKEKLDGRLQMNRIIDRTQGQNDGLANQQGRPARKERITDQRKVKIMPQNDRDIESEKDGNPAEKRDGPFVYISV